MGTRMRAEYQVARALGAIVLRLLIVAATIRPVGAAELSGFTPFRSGPVVLEGNWQSCREQDGEYGERIFDGPGFELHLGPFHEFALFASRQDEHRSHDSSANLLRPHVVGGSDEQLARHEWTALGYRFHVTLAGGSRTDCESWWILVTRAGS
jgi:hypothetical protein